MVRRKQREDGVKERGKVRVISYSGSRKDEHPVEFYIEDKKFVIKEWSPLGKEEVEGERREGFFIKTEDGGEYILYHYLEDDRWTILKKN
jgi:hypothetical protein